jgi:hypothetical protein
MMGVGAILHALSGGSDHDPGEFAGLTIQNARMHNDKLYLTLGTTVAIFDNGQSCCEHRYMTTDDDLQSLIGHELRRIESKPSGIEQANDEYGGEHETVFIEVGTDVGFVTIVNHNEHNGYYGGFGLTIVKEDPPPLN